MKDTKTFDIALKYLKDSYATKIPNTRDLESIHKKFLDDKNNTESNEHYRSTVFMACVYHLLDLASNRPSCFYVASEIIEGNKNILLTKFEKYANTVYPKIMIDLWDKYNNPELDGSEIKFGVFATAYSYLID